MTDFLYVDTESMGLDLLTHDIWELAWALNDDEIVQGFIAHDASVFEPEALKVNRYMERYDETDLNPDVEYMLADTLHHYRDHGRALTLVGANPSFDAYRLSRRWEWGQPWHYRMLDISTYAMPWMESDLPVGMRELYLEVRKWWDRCPEPDHTAAGDVATLRFIHKVLMAEYAEMDFRE